MIVEAEEIIFEKVVLLLSLQYENDTHVHVPATDLARAQSLGRSL